MYNSCLSVVVVHLLLHLDLHQIGVVLGQQLVSDIKQIQRASENMASKPARSLDAPWRAPMFMHTIGSHIDGYHQNDDRFIGGSATIEAALQSQEHSRGCDHTTFIL